LTPEPEGARALAHLNVVGHLRAADEAVDRARRGVEDGRQIDGVMLAALEALANLGTALAVLGMEVFRDGG
jgi:hypothetical protein